MADLCSIDDVRKWLSVKGNDDDELLTNLIGRASAFIRSYTGRELDAGSYSEKRDGHGGRRLVFREYPVTAVSVVKIDNTAIPASVNQSPGYVFDQLSLTLIGYRFSEGLSNVELQYTAGYAANALPPDLVQACIELVSLRYRGKSHIGKSSDALATGMQTNYIVDDLMPEIKMALDQHRRLIPV